MTFAISVWLTPNMSVNTQIIKFVMAARNSSTYFNFFYKSYMFSLCGPWALNAIGICHILEL